MKGTRTLLNDTKFDYVTLIIDNLPVDADGYDSQRKRFF
jgi:hypothetical protein